MEVIFLLFSRGKKGLCSYFGLWFFIKSLYYLLTLIIYRQSLVFDKTQSTYLEATSD